MRTDTYSLHILPLLIIGKDQIMLDEVPKPFQNDLKTFLIGETFMNSSDGRILVGAKLYEAWINKLLLKGFDEDVKLFIDESKV
jgi:hypothetical protein